MKDLDVKDFKIIRELDTGFRQSFSKIAKKVGLSKNSTALRFENLKSYMLHNTIGLNNEILGYKMVKIFYSFDFYNEEFEQQIINELKKHKNILWAARLYGDYDLCICLLVDNLDILVTQVSEFNERFSKKINKKEIQIVSKQIYFRHNFLHSTPINQVYEVSSQIKKVALDEKDKKIILLLRHEPRISLLDLSRKINLSPLTIKSRIKNLETKGVIMGYFMTLNPAKFGFNQFKLLIQLKQSNKDFEKYLISMKSTKYLTKMLGLFDYEIDCVFKDTTQLQEEIEIMRSKFPVISHIEIISFGKRIVTNKENFLD
jgi:Lrp/AsnC family transcriptional regulator, leucine-responsive regulatory protein